MNKVLKHIIDYCEERGIDQEDIFINVGRLCNRRVDQFIASLGIEVPDSNHYEFVNIYCTTDLYLTYTHSDKGSPIREEKECISYFSIFPNGHESIGEEKKDGGAFEPKKLITPNQTPQEIIEGLISKYGEFLIICNSQKEIKQLNSTLNLMEYTWFSGRSLISNQHLDRPIRSIGKNKRIKYGRDANKPLPEINFNQIFKNNNNEVLRQDQRHGKTVGRPLQIHRRKIKAKSGCRPTGSKATNFKFRGKLNRSSIEGRKLFTN